ncbi:MAG: grasp-with-spasm system ATP-grasp peptide maturase [Bacteroidota bacterium]
MQPNKHLIFSHAFDYSTDQVMDWLSSFGQRVERVNSDNTLAQEQDISFSTSTNSERDDSVKYASIWFRKVAKRLRQESIEKEQLADPIFEATRPYFHQTIDQEWQNISDHYHQKFHSSHLLSRYLPFPLNKLYVLERAQNLGLDIPDTLITRQRSSLLAFLQKYPKGIINKSIADHLTFADQSPKRKTYANYTEEIYASMIEDFPTKFGPSLFQEKLDKKYEIRVFYLAGKCFSMAIFSQGSTQTQLDFRRYDAKHPSRRTAYQLAQHIEEQIHLLMTDLKLNTGSLDFVQTTDGRTVFLEVNPSGQFGMTSYPCNYYLTKKIAEYLSQHESKKT